MSRSVTRQPYEAKLAKTRQNYLELIAADVRMCSCTCMIVLEQQDVSYRVWPLERSFLAELSLLIFNPEAPSDHQSLWPFVRSHFSMSCWQPALICVSSSNLPVSFRHYTKADSTMLQTIRFLQNAPKVQSKSASPSACICPHQNPPIRRRITVSPSLRG
jgi:hypothetical protein